MLAIGLAGWSMLCRSELRSEDYGERSGQASGLLKLRARLNLLQSQSARICGRRRLISPEAMRARPHRLTERDHSAIMILRGSLGPHLHAMHRLMLHGGMIA